MLHVVKIVTHTVLILQGLEYTMSTCSDAIKYESSVFLETYARNSIYNGAQNTK